MFLTAVSTQTGISAPLRQRASWKFKTAETNVWSRQCFSIVWGSRSSSDVWPWHWSMWFISSHSSSPQKMVHATATSKLFHRWRACNKGRSPGQSQWDELWLVSAVHNRDVIFLTRTFLNELRCRRGCGYLLNKLIESLEQGDLLLCSLHISTISWSSISKLMRVDPDMWSSHSTLPYCRFLDLKPCGDSRMLISPLFCGGRSGNLLFILTASISPVWVPSPKAPSLKKVHPKEKFLFWCWAALQGWERNPHIRCSVHHHKGSILFLHLKHDKFISLYPAVNVHTIPLLLGVTDQVQRVL